MFATLYLIELLVARPPGYTVYTRQSETHRISHSNVLGVLEVCLELLSGLKDQSGFFR